MASFGDDAFRPCKEWIEQQYFHRRRSWDDIDHALRRDDTGLAVFLTDQADFEEWPTVSIAEWHESIRQMREAVENQPPAEWGEGIRVEEQDVEGRNILPADVINQFQVPDDQHSAWQLYKRYLQTVEGWPEISIDNLERSALFLLNRLGECTVPGDPVKGLVLGYVQSGKTANMEALMAMAADHGWNMFILLSGTKDNLREQTRDRIIADLTCQNGNIRWRGIEHPAAANGNPYEQLQNLFYNGNERYVTVCLKEPTRLRQLQTWLNSDVRAHQQMKILVIDDEADQASINNRVATPNERTTINRSLVELVKDNTHIVQGHTYHAQAMNYLMYTATPYANFLNETGRDSLYPRNFIYSLEPPREYLGPNQWFGDGNNKGLNIKRIIPAAEISAVKRLQNGGNNQGELPDELKKAFAWFYCCAAVMRVWYARSPRAVSMLIHCSQRTNHHTNLAQAVDNWIRNNRANGNLMRLCRTVYDGIDRQGTITGETRKETKEAWQEQLPGYGGNIRDYPTFEEIEANLNALLNGDLRSLPVDRNNGKPLFEGTAPYLAIDNCNNNQIIDGQYRRLLYPDRHEQNPRHRPQICPAYIVIGGNTLSRGLTIEGLVSTYFLRTSNQYDTLMQMGRWFGYRRGYELLPRLWVSQTTLEKFEFLAEQELKLREELRYYGLAGITPKEYAPSITLPGKPMSWLRPTRSGGMNAAVETGWDFRGAVPQTITFDSDEEIQFANIKHTENFINTVLGDECRVSANGTSLYWRHISLENIVDYLQGFHFCARANVFSDIGSFTGFLNETPGLENWNVVVIGVGQVRDVQDGEENTPLDETHWTTHGKILGKSTRSKLAGIEDPDVIYLRAITSPLDRLSDVDADIIEAYKAGNHRNLKQEDVKAIRTNAGIDNIPQLIIYRIDRNSQPERANTNREALNSAHDLIGLQVCIPGGRTNFVKAVQAQLNEDNEADNLEEQD